MKQEILNAIHNLGGDISRVSGNSLLEDIQSISFKTVLYPRPEDTPWGVAGEEEPIYGIDDYIEANRTLLNTDKAAFYQKLIAYYYELTEEGRGQMFWSGQLFTPYLEGSADYQEWNADFRDAVSVDLSEIEKVVGVKQPTMVQLFYSYGFPDHYYICLEDPNPDNPTVFGTDHEEFFMEISNEGSLEEFMQQFISPEELISIVDKTLNNN
ncbi:hypothetical protein VSO92_05445 [Myroides pelagicus]|uniref:hypothetical protein n=1 Tax=Myroides pelagicus TaxID=270914 RepID=UPI002DB8D019|nr:hypothetical protein [Myroides pelagicus]MEC4113551.1 hypothetical protein [Myroides pelagicus]